MRHGNSPAAAKSPPAAFFLLERSLSMDVNYARAHGTLSHTYAIAWTSRLDEDHLNPVALDRAYQLALKAVALDPNLPVAHAHLGSALTWKRQLDAALAEFERAIALNPNFTDWRLTSADLCGRTGEGRKRGARTYAAQSILSSHDARLAGARSLSIEALCGRVGAAPRMCLAHAEVQVGPHPLGRHLCAAGSPEGGLG
jgi:tetratricopeptide (TPR) repeat protein